MLLSTWELITGKWKKNPNFLKCLKRKLASVKQWSNIIKSKLHFYQCTVECDLHNWKFHRIYPVI